MAECGRAATARRGVVKETRIAKTDSKGTVLQPGERETISMPGNKMSFVHRQPDSAFSMVEWASEPGGRARRYTSTG